MDTLPKKSIVSKSGVGASPQRLFNPEYNDVYAMVFMQFDYDQLMGVIQDNPTITLSDFFWTEHLFRAINIHPKDIKQTLSIINNIPIPINRTRTYTEDPNNKLKIVPQSDEIKLGIKLQDFFIESAEKCRHYYIKTIMRIYPAILTDDYVIIHLIKALSKNILAYNCIEDVFLQILELTSQNKLNRVAILQKQLEDVNNKLKTIETQKIKSMINDVKGIRYAPESKKVAKIEVLLTQLGYDKKSRQLKNTLQQIKLLLIQSDYLKRIIKLELNDKNLFTSQISFIMKMIDLNEISSKTFGFLCVLCGADFDTDWFDVHKHYKERGKLYLIQSENFTNIFDSLLQYHPDQVEEWVFDYFVNTINNKSTGQIVALLTNKIFMNHLPIDSVTYDFLINNLPIKYAPYISKIRHLTNNSKGKYIPKSKQEAEKWIKFGFDPDMVVLPVRKVILLTDKGINRDLRLVLSGRVKSQVFLNHIEGQKIYIQWRDRDGHVHYLFPRKQNMLIIEKAAKETEDASQFVAEYMKDLLAVDLDQVQLFQIVYVVQNKKYDKLKDAWKRISELQYKDLLQKDDESPKNSSEEENSSEESSAESPKSIKRRMIRQQQLSNRRREIRKRKLLRQGRLQRNDTSTSEDVASEESSSLSESSSSSESVKENTKKKIIQMIANHSPTSTSEEETSPRRVVKRIIKKPSKKRNYTESTSEEETSPKRTVKKSSKKYSTESTSEEETESDWEYK